MLTSLEQVNKPSYEMVTKIQQQTRSIRLNLTETHDQMFLYQSEFVIVLIILIHYGICLLLCDLKLQVIFSSIYLRYHWSWQEPITLTGAVDDSHCIFYLKVYYIQFSLFFVLFAFSSKQENPKECLKFLREDLKCLIEVKSETQFF